MQLPAALRNLDDRVLSRGRRTGDAPPDVPAGSEPATPHHHVGRGDAPAEPPRPPRRVRRPAGDVALEVLGVVRRVARWVLLALAVVVLVGIGLTFAPTNEDNDLVRTGLSWAEDVAGPFRDVFTDDDADRELLYNYGLAAAVYLLAAVLVGRLPGARRRTRR